MNDSPRMEWGSVVCVGRAKARPSAVAGGGGHAGHAGRIARWSVRRGLPRRAIAALQDASRRFLWGLVGAGVIALGAAGIPAAYGAAAVLVNRQEVSREEFQWFMAQELPRESERFKVGADPEFGSNFWTRSQDGTTPRARLRQKTIARVVSEKVEQELFADLGLVKSTRYSDFLKDLERANRERESAFRRGGAVYGPITYSQLQYYDYWKARLRIQAKQRLAARLGATQDKLRSFYDQNQEWFRAEERWTLEIFSLRVAPRTDSNWKAERFEAAAREIARRMTSGGESPQAAARYATEHDIAITRRQLDSLARDRMSELFSGEAALKPALALSQGEWMTTSTSTGEVEVVRCLAHDHGGYAAYERVKASVRSKFLDREYSRLLDDQIAKAKVEIYDAVIAPLFP